MYRQNNRKRVRRIVSILLVCVIMILGIGMDLQRTAASELNMDNANVSGVDISKNDSKKKGKSELELTKKKDMLLVKNSSTLAVINVKKNYKIEFSSSDTDILEVKQKSQTVCEYQGKKTGTAYINVKITKPGFLFMPSNKYLQCQVTVFPKAVSISFTKKTLKMKIKNSKKLKLTTRPSISKEKAVFESSDPDVADVDSNGKVTAKSVGTAVITARISNGKTANCKIIVRERENKKK